MESATTSSQIVRRSTEKRREIITWLLGILSVLLTLSLIVGGVFTRLELAARRSLAQNLQAQVDSLTQANLELQDSVNALLAERDNLSQQVNQLEATKADQAQQIEKLTAKTEELQKKTEALLKENSELSQQVREQSRQLSEAHAEATRNQQLAEAAQTRTAILARILTLDDEIYSEYRNLFLAVLDMQDAYYTGNRTLFASAEARAEASSKRLEQLFAQRNQLIQQLQSS